MKKQYMDFVPAGKKKAVKPKTVVSGGAVKTVRSAGAAAVARPATMKAMTARTVTTAPKVDNTAKPRMKFAGEKEPELGKVENLNQRFVKTQVTKRPLSSEIAAAKAKKVGLQAPVAKKVATRTEKQAPKKQAAEVGTYVPPKNKFVNLSKIEKRPLSKTVYAKKVEVPTEEPQGPVTIISKPEKQNHAGLIVTVIITIILGAAAGTVAFMLLPK